MLVCVGGSAAKENLAYKYNVYDQVKSMIGKSAATGHILVQQYRLVVSVLAYIRVHIRAHVV